MSNRTFVSVLFSVVGLFATEAVAHPKLLTSNPASGASLTATPKYIQMKFSEGLVLPFTGLELKNASGKVIPTGKTALDGDKKKVVVPVQAELTAGTYSVSWHAVSTDTHRVSGQYTFKVMR